jgi:short-subunit dehydrogenase
MSSDQQSNCPKIDSLIPTFTFIGVNKKRNDKKETTAMRILILGATSMLAHETAKLFAKDGAEFVLVARSPEKLTAVADDLTVRGAKKVATILADLSDLTRHQEVLNEALGAFSGLDMVLVAYGTLGDQLLSQQNVEATLREWNNNCTSVISLLTLLANYFEQEGRGCLAVISSVAGDRGRQSNYIYGAAKAAVTVFLQGLRNRLAKKGVSVITIKPGMVDTPMTAHMPKSLLLADPQVVGRGIYQAMLKRREVVYLPGYWRYIMWIIKSIPEPIEDHEHAQPCEIGNQQAGIERLIVYEWSEKPFQQGKERKKGHSFGSVAMDGNSDVPNAIPIIPGEQQPSGRKRSWGMTIDEK